MGITEARVERIEKTVPAVKPPTLEIAQGPGSRNADLGCKGNRGYRGGGGKRAMVFLIGHALRPIGRIAIKLRRLAFKVDDEITWSIASAETPDVLGITVPTHGVRNGIVALRIGGAAGILEIVKPGRARGRIIDAAIVHPHGPILMRKVRRKGEVAVRTFSAPIFWEGRSPCLEGAVLSRVRP